MRSYQEVMELMGLKKGQLSEDDYLRAVMITRKKAQGKGAWYREILLPDVIKEMLFSRWTAERCERLRKEGSQNAQ